MKTNSSGTANTQVDRLCETGELMEAAKGFEPLDNGFADHCLSHLATPPQWVRNNSSVTLGDLGWKVKIVCIELIKYM